MKKATIVYITRNNQGVKEVLLAIKQKFVGIGKWFGYGGKIEKGETPKACTVRETADETGKKAGLPYITLNPDKLRPVALITFYRGETATNALFQVLFYTCDTYTGEASDTDEMQNPTWFPVDGLPKLKEGDELIVPKILNGEILKGWIRFSENGEKLISHDIQPATAEELVFEN